jgi:hypothetical protein
MAFEQIYSEREGYPHQHMTSSYTPGMGVKKVKSKAIPVTGREGL